MEKTKRDLLGVQIDELKGEEVVVKVMEWVKDKGRAKTIATVYSEFLVEADNNKDFRKVLDKIDLRIVDGALVLGGLRYQEMNEKRARLVLNGLSVGWRGLRGKNGETVTGVWLFERLVEEAARQGWKVFLLGGFGDTSRRLKEKLEKDHPGLRIEYDAGGQSVGDIKKENQRVIKKINDFEPELLMVAYGPVRQEVWMVENRRKVKAKVMIGLGGTFDEVLGLITRSPEWMDRSGLRWLWRVYKQPKRLKRIWKAVVVCPWRLYKEEVKKYGKKK